MVDKGWQCVRRDDKWGGGKREDEEKSGREMWVVRYRKG